MHVKVGLIDTVHDLVKVRAGEERLAIVTHVRPIGSQIESKLSGQNIKFCLPRKL